VYSQRSKLRRWVTDEWKERCLGDARLLKNRSSGRVRFLMRMEKTNKICANFFPVKEAGLCELKLNQGNPKILQWMCMDYSEEGAVEQFALSFKDKELTEKFREAFEQAKEANSGGGSVKSPVTGGPKEVSSPAPKLEKESASVSPAASSLFGGASSSSLFGGGGTASGLFGGGAPGSLFGGGGGSSGSLFGGSGQLGGSAGSSGGGLFSGLSAQSPSSGSLFGSAASGSGLFGSGGGSGLFGGSSSGSGLFGGAAGGAKPESSVEGGGKADDDDRFVEEEEVTEIEGWKPSVTLDVIDVQTGEEEEEEVYSQRSKLRRWVTDEWKERCLGDARLLKNRSSGRVRFLMRMEKTNKICANFFPVKEAGLCELKLNQGNPKILQWMCMDYSEEGAVEQFALSFKDKELTEKFREAFEQAKEANSGGGSVKFPVASSGPQQNSSSLFNVPVQASGGFSGAPLFGGSTGMVGSSSSLFGASISASAPSFAFGAAPTGLFGSAAAGATPAPQIRSGLGLQQPATLPTQDDGTDNTVQDEDADWEQEWDLFYAGGRVCKAGCFGTVTWVDDAQETCTVLWDDDTETAEAVIDLTAVDSDQEDDPTTTGTGAAMMPTSLAALAAAQNDPTKWSCDVCGCKWAASEIKCGACEADKPGLEPVAAKAVTDSRTDATAAFLGKAFTTTPSSGSAFSGATASAFLGGSTAAAPLTASGFVFGSAGGVPPASLPAFAAAGAVADSATSGAASKAAPFIFGQPAESKGEAMAEVKAQASSSVPQPEVAPACGTPGQVNHTAVGRSSADLSAPPGWTVLPAHTVSVAPGVAESAASLQSTLLAVDRLRSEMQAQRKQFQEVEERMGKRSQEVLDTCAEMLKWAKRMEQRAEDREEEWARRLRTSKQEYERLEEMLAAALKSQGT